MGELQRPRYRGFVAESVQALSGCTTLLAPQCVQQPQSSSDPVVWGILWRFHFIGETDEILGMCAGAQGCLTLCNPMDCSSPGSSVHGIFQARILEWFAISSSKTEYGPTYIPYLPLSAPGYTDPFIQNGLSFLLHISKIHRFQDLQMPLLP